MLNHLNACLLLVGNVLAARWPVESTFDRSDCCANLSHYLRCSEAGAVKDHGVLSRGLGPTLQSRSAHVLPTPEGMTMCLPFIQCAIHGSVAAESRTYPAEKRLVVLFQQSQLRKSAPYLLLLEE